MCARLIWVCINAEIVISRMAQDVCNILNITTTTCTWPYPSSWMYECMVLKRVWHCICQCSDVNNGWQSYTVQHIAVWKMLAEFLLCVAARKLNVRKPEWIQSMQRTRRSLTHAVSLRCRRLTSTWKSMQRSEHNVIFSDMFWFCALNLSFTSLF